MKKRGITLVCGVAMGLSGWGQVLTPGGPALPSSGPAPVLSPDGTVLIPGAVVAPPSPALNVVISVGTNQPVAPVNVTDLASVLLNLRFVVDRALPRLAAYNGAVQAVNSGTNIDNSTANGAVSVGSSGVNLGANLSQNLSAAAGANLSANFSSVVGATPAMGVSGTPAASTNAAANLAAAPTQSTNATSSVLTTQETIGALQVLQDDLAQAQSILNALSVGPGVAAPLPPTGP